ncbi:hypothetical protein EVAR_94636_1 [Eumeta japonica]|uniref:Uncharacterized protein n=1 Tax=Eumeta variegata TaxID=151549 RepID=A0A4C1UUY2_EUMVA|nr:hypothetical protein EVAR_94636_1 [Eumeta japonica]
MDPLESRPNRESKAKPRLESRARRISVGNRIGMRIEHGSAIDITTESVISRCRKRRNSLYSHFSVCQSSPQAAEPMMEAVALLNDEELGDNTAIYHKKLIFNGYQ